MSGQATKYMYKYHYGIIPSSYFFKAILHTLSVLIGYRNISTIWEKICCHGDSKCLVRHLSQLSKMRRPIIANFKAHQTWKP